tara:strand:+ start:981 stop:1631 length:651 start_codon:yes stop_codon:yes gene_type:complete
MKLAPVLYPKPIKDVKWNIPPLEFRLVGEIDDEIADKFVSFLFRCYKNKQTIIPVYIDSNGGCAYALFKMLSAIKRCPASCKIATIAEGHAMSAAAALLTAGHENFRFASPLTTIMIHDIHIEGLEGGSVQDIRVESDEMERLNTLMYEEMDTNCKQKQGFFKSLVKERELNNNNWYLNGEEAKAIGLVNELDYPEFIVDLKISYKLYKKRKREDQ